MLRTFTLDLTDDEVDAIECALNDHQGMTQDDPTVGKGTLTYNALEKLRLAFFEETQRS